MNRFILIIMLILLNGCAGKHSGYVATQPATEQSGFYHKVQPGETLWSIANAYNVNLEKLAKTNHIPDVTKISAGQMIFVPGTQTTTTKVTERQKIGNFVWPVQGRVAAYFGSIANNVVNKGIDVIPASNQSVLAASGGKIVFIGKSLPGYGDTVIIDHDNGIATVYSNVQSIKQDPGKSIKQGEAIASVRKNDFFHFEVRQGAKPVNPMYYLP